MAPPPQERIVPFSPLPFIDFQPPLERLSLQSRQRADFIYDNFGRSVVRSVVYCFAQQLTGQISKALLAEAAQRNQVQDI
jgi:hypothetical protein